MKNFRLKLIPFFFVCFFSLSTQINFHSSQCGESIPTARGNQIEYVTAEENYSTVENIFYSKSEIKTGDVMECEVTKTKSLAANYNDDHVFTQIGKDKFGYVFYPVSKDKKCFSFEIRSQKVAHILLSSGPNVVDGQRLEILLLHEGTSYIRTKDNQQHSKVPTPDIINNRELRGFWIRWLDDQFLEIGRNTDTYPILSHRLSERIFVNFIGILSYTVEGEWIIHGEPKCGQYNVTEKRTEAETKCKILTGNSKTNNILQKSQQHILNQIKTQHEIFKISKFRSTEIILEYQQTIRRHFKNAEENQNRIYAADNEVYCPLKSIIFNEITKEYYQFLEVLQQELSILNETIVHSEKVIKHCGGCCCGCNTDTNYYKSVMANS